MQLQADIVSSQISRGVRAANLVFAADEAWTKTPALAQRDVSEIRCYDSTGAVTGAYQLTGGVLRESADAVTFKVFKAGGDTVFAAAGSAFRLSTTRKEVTLLLKMALQYHSSNYTSMVIGDMYRCRN
jgi:stress response protein SCP2